MIKTGKRRIYLFLLITMCYLSVSNLLSKNSLLDDIINSKKTAGLFTGLNFNNHIVDFARFENYPLCCTNFDYGLGLGFGFGLLSDFKLDNYPVDLQFRLGYNSLSGEFRRSEPKVLGIEGLPVNGNIEYSIFTNISTLDFSAYAKKEIIPNLNLFAGIKFGLVTQSSFEQQEKISHGVFRDTESNIRNRKSGDIPDFASIISFLSIGVNYDYKIFDDSIWTISPELFADFGLHNLQSDSSWLIIIPKIGISLTYHIQPPAKEKIEFEYKEFIDTIEVKNVILSQNKIVKGTPKITVDSVFHPKENIRRITQISYRTDTLFIVKDMKLQASIRAVAVEDGVEKQIVTMEIKEYQYFNMRPLLNYIFFDENSSQIPDRYKLLNKKEAMEFDLRQINDLKTLETYYHILNIIGYRMKLHPRSIINIVGCNSNISTELNNLTLSTDRAEVVLDYFTNVWGISPDRIKLKSRNIPDKPSPIENADGIQENRRVEIYSDNIDILSPLLIDDTLKTTTPSDIRFYPNVVAEAGLKNWSVQAYQENIIYKEFFGNDKLLTYLDWSIDLEKTSIPSFNQPLLFHIEAMDSLNRNIISKIDSIPLIQRKIEITKNQVGDKKVEHFSLILFDFDDTSLNESNRRIKDYIKTKIAPTSKVIIAGYTDRLGDETYNQKLSLSRANSLAKLLNLSPDATKGLGESVLLYDNNLPEGRFYCRTVEVIIETPLLKNQED